MDPNEKLREILSQKGWTEYKLSKTSGLSESTITNIFKRNTVPSIHTLETICKAFNLTLSQFFAEDEMIETTPDFKELFDSWKYLNSEQKQAVIALLKSFSHNN